MRHEILNNGYENPVLAFSVSTFEDILSRPENYILHSIFGNQQPLDQVTTKKERPLTSIAFLFALPTDEQDNLFFQVTFSHSRHSANKEYFVSYSIVVSPPQDREAQTSISQTYALNDSLEPVNIRTKKAMSQVTQALKILKEKPNEAKPVRIKCTDFIDLPGKITLKA